MTAQRKEISIGILHVTTRQRRECRGDNRFTARFRCTSRRLCFSSGNGKALQSGLPLALSGNCGSCSRTTGTICGGNVSRSCACNALVSNGVPIATPIARQLTRITTGGCRLVNRTGVGNCLFDIRQRLRHESVSPSSIRCREFLADRHCAEVLHRAVIQPAATSPVRSSVHLGRKEWQ